MMPREDLLSVPLISAVVSLLLHVELRIFESVEAEFNLMCQICLLLHVELRIFESVEAEFNLMCQICLDTVYVYPMALGRGHLLCNSCSGAVAYIPIDEGINIAEPLAKCPICKHERNYTSEKIIEEQGKDINEFKNWTLYVVPKFSRPPDDMLKFDVLCCNNHLLQNYLLCCNIR